MSLVETTAALPPPQLRVLQQAVRRLQSVAQGHFAIRRLEREYGPAVVRRLYEEIAPRYGPTAPA